MTLPTKSADLASSYSGFQGLSRLKAAARDPSAAAKNQVAKRFEALFIDMMLKAMREATPKNSLLGNSQQRLYQGLYDNRIALSLVQGQGFGLQTMIQKTMNEGRGSKVSHPINASLSATPMTPSLPQATTQTKKVATPQVHSGRPTSPQAFVRRVLPYAQSAAEKIGVSPAVLVAQAALETGWGKHVPTGPDGKNSYNFLGIKAGNDWSGSKINMPTLEYRDGVAQQTQASFRAYPSIKACFDNYVHLITHHPRYQQALAQSGTVSGYLKGLEAGGYATDPAYTAKIGAILNGSTLSKSLVDIKKMDGTPLT